MTYWVSTVELQSLPGTLSVPKEYPEALLLLRNRGKPLGWLCLDARVRRDYQEVDLRQEILSRRGFEIAREAFLREHVPAQQPPQPFPPISVLICTRDRADFLQKCLEELKQVEYPGYEVLVIDNASTTSATREVAGRFGVRYVREERPGLDRARNRGVLEARHEIVAFLDDDACPDRGWLKAIGRNFAEPDVMALTGLVLPQELRTDAQEYFEHVYGGMGKGFRRCTWHKSVMGNKRLLWASAWGVGANMAFRRSLFEKIGLFDVALDVGTATRGGGDVEFLHRTIARGYVLRYEPEASVWHTHRAEFPSLRRQLFNNGCSVIPYLLTCRRNRTVPTGVILRHVFGEILYRWYWRRFLKPGRHKRSLILAEVQGFLYGLFLYPVARREAARLGQQPEQKGNPGCGVGDLKSMKINLT